MLISQFETNMLKTCWFTTLAALGYRTHVGLHNPLPHGALPEDDLCVSLSLFTTDGAEVLRSMNLGILKPGERRNLGIDDLAFGIEDGSQDFVGTIHLVPSRLSNNDTLSISMDDLGRWMSMSDEFVGYTHKQTRLQSGVHYQTPPMNDDRFRSSRTTIMQSPKVVVNESTDTLILVVAPSSSADFSRDIPFHLVILDCSGNPVARSSVVVPARGRRMVSIRSVLEDAGMLGCFIERSGFGMAVGLAVEGALLPLTITATSSGGLAVDHTLPPPYYMPGWDGNPRRIATDYLIKMLFPSSELS